MTDEFDELAITVPVKTLELNIACSNKDEKDAIISLLASVNVQTRCRMRLNHVRKDRNSSANEVMDAAMEFRNAESETARCIEKLCDVIEAVLS